MFLLQDQLLSLVDFITLIPELKKKTDKNRIFRHMTSLKSVLWTLAEFYYNRSLQRPHTRTCTIWQETVNRFLCPHIVFLKSKTH